MTKSNRMLVAAPERWDEACFAAPAVRALVASGLQVGVICGETQVDFWRTLKEIVVMNLQENHDLSDWNAALAWEYGPIAKTILKAGVARRIAPTGDRKLTKWATDPAEVAVHVLEHRVQYFLATVEGLGVATHEAEFFAAANAREEQNANAMLLCPDSDFGPSHEWPLERWIELARWLAGECSTKVAIADLAGTRGLGAHLAEILGDQAEAIQVTSIAEAMPHLARYPIFISADGSLPHLAAHLGTTCGVLFGPNDPAWRRPLGKHHVMISHHTECAPCLMAKCPLDHRCMLRLEVETVKVAISRLLSGMQVARTR